MSTVLEESGTSFDYYAARDRVTGLRNRPFFMLRVQEAIERVRTTPGYGFSVILLDLDRFRAVNEMFSYRGGDLVLRTVARRLERHARPNDSLARSGGNEFAILLDGIDDIADVTAVVERCIAGLAEQIPVEKRVAIVAASFGMAVWDDAYVDGETLMHNAQIALQRTRQYAGQTYMAFSDSMQEQEAHMLQLREDLAHALVDEQFTLHYQPIVDHLEARICGFEAFIRWRHPERGLMSPIEFLPIAEEMGLIVEIGAWALRRAAQKARDWQQLMHAPLLMCVNIFSGQLCDPHFYEIVAEALDFSGLDPSNLQLEIGESVFLEDITSASAALDRVRALGVRTALDDFGSGFASLSYLERNQIDALKIDRRFVTHLDDNTVRSDIAGMIISLARSFGLAVIAEGVEKEHQRDALVSMGCTQHQGYYYSRPIAEDEVITQFLTHWETQPELAALLYGEPTHELPKSSPEEQRELRAQVGAAIKIHAMWDRRIESAIESGSSELNPETVVRADLCPVGMWLVQVIAEKFKSATLYTTTLARHAEFHRLGALALTLATDDPIAARHAMRTGGDFRVASGDFTQSLHDWLVACDCSAHDETVFV